MVEPSFESLTMNPVPEVLGWEMIGLAQREIVRRRDAGDIDVAGWIECDRISDVDSFAGERVGKEDLAVGVELGDEDVGWADEGVVRRDNDRRGRRCWARDSDNDAGNASELAAADYIGIACRIGGHSGDGVGIGIAKRGGEFAGQRQGCG